MSALEAKEVVCTCFELGDEAAIVTRLGPDLVCFDLWERIRRGRMSGARRDWCEADLNGALVWRECKTGRFVRGNRGEPW